MNVNSPERLEQFLLILLLACLAFAQPLFDLLGSQAEFFVAHRFGAVELVTLSLLLGIFVPLAIALLPLLTARISKKIGTAIFFLLFFLLTALTASPAVIMTGLQGASALIAALLISIVVILLYRKAPALRMFFKFLSPAVLVFPILFLFLSRATPLLLSNQNNAGPGQITLHSKPDIVFLVLDEFPLVSLLNSGLEIDRVRYPNFARLADQSNWYQGTTTAAETTVMSVPALLSGLNPKLTTKLLPIAANYPRNLFSLLHDDYRMIANETATSLCPENVCRTENLEISRENTLIGLIQDLKLIYRHIVTPAPWSTRLPPISNAWSGFTAIEEQREKFRTDSGGLENARALAKLSANVSWRTRSSEVEQFITAIQPGEQPQLFYLHALLPHAVWRYLPGGQQYLTDEPWEAIKHSKEPSQSDIWHDDRFAVYQQWQRHLLQVQYVDTLLGMLLDQLESENMLDSSLLIVTGDHGASFIPGQPRRTINEGTLSDISAVPLFIHTPGQIRGHVDSHAVSLTDVLPTVADVLESTIDWSFDGHSLLDGTYGRDAVRIAKKDGKVFEYPVTDHLRHLQERAKELNKVFGRGDDYRFFNTGPYPQLVGSDPGELPSATTSGAMVLIEDEQLFQNVNPNASFVPRHIKGRIQGLPDVASPRKLAIAVNGVIQATSQTLDIASYRDTFSAMLADNVLKPGHNAVQVYLIEDNTDGISLSRLGRRNAPDWKLISVDGTDTIHSDAIGSFHVQSSEAAGKVSMSEIETGSLINLTGTVGHTAGNGSIVVAFLDKQLAGSGTISGTHFSIKVSSQRTVPISAIDARIFVLDTYQQAAFEVDYPPPCSPQWKFAPPGAWMNSDCTAVVNSPLTAGANGFAASLVMNDPSVRQFLISGWGAPDSATVWTLGLSSTLEIPLPPGLKNLSFTALIKPFLHAPNHSSQALWITANGQPVGSWALDGNGFVEINWQVPEAVLKSHPDNLQLTFLLPDAVSPKSIGAGEDLRTLGIAVQRIDIQAD